MLARPSAAELSAQPIGDTEPAVFTAWSMRSTTMR